MPVTLILIEIVGYVVLLLWGMRMVHSGVVRAYGSNLRRVLGARLANRFGAALAGMLVTILLQSSTATALMTTSFAADGVVALVPALAVLLGANVGTALVVRALSFDISAVAPMLLIAGYVAFGRAAKGRVHDLGRVGIGLGLMLLALHLLVQSIEPGQAAPALGGLLSVLTREPLLAVLLATALTWLAHSSVATMLLVVSLAGANVITPVAALALVLGANLGSTIPPMLESGHSDPAARRLPVGNFAFRLIGCIAVFPFLHPIAEYLWGGDASPGAAVIGFHLAFNIVLAVAFIGLLDPAAALLTKLLPERPKELDPGTPLYLDETAIETPYLALAHATREVLRMADMLQAMLTGFLPAMRARDRLAIDAMQRSAKAVGRLGDSIRSYLTRLAADPLVEQDSRRCGILLDLAVNLGHAAGIVGRNLAITAERRIKRALPFGAEDEADLTGFHALVLADLKLAIATLMGDDPRLARELLDAKRRLNEQERVITRQHLGRLDANRPQSLDASTIHLALLRDLRRVNSHLAAIAYDILELGPPAGEESSAESDVPAEPSSAEEWPASAPDRSAIE